MLPFKQTLHKALDLSALGRAESLAAPIIGAELRYRGKWLICSEYAPIFPFLIKYKRYYLMKKSEHIESRLYSRNIKIIYLHFDPNLLRFSRFFSGFCPDFAPILSSKDLPRSQFFLTKDSATHPGKFFLSSS